MSTELARSDQHDELPSTQVAEAITSALEGLRAVRTFVKQQFKEGVDFGVIPGCGDKPTLFLPGAQKAMMYFNSRPKRVIDRVDLGGGHVEYIITTKLVSRATKEYIGEGLGCCSTMESKYRYRKAERLCPKCGKPAIINGKAEYGGGYVCFHKKGGCGAKFNKGDRAIESQSQGQAENPDLYDVHNTVLKMGKKRADVDAAMTLGCLSELFTQDIEDTFPMVEVREAARPEPEPEEYHVNGEIIEPAPTASTKGLFTKEHKLKTVEFVAWLTPKATKANDRWLDEWADTLMAKQGEGLAVPEKVADMVTTTQLKGHLLKWAKDAGWLDPAIVPEDVKPYNCEAYLARVYAEEGGKEAILAELGLYFKDQRRIKTAAFYKRYPQLAPDGYAEEQTEAAAKASQEVEATAESAPADDTHDSTPRTGGELIQWASDMEDRHEVQVMKYLKSWANLQDFPEAMIDWDRDQVAQALAEGIRKLMSLRSYVEDQAALANGITEKG